MEIKQETPIPFPQSSFFTEAQLLESKLKRTKVTQNNKQEAIQQLIHQKPELDNLVQEFLRNIYHSQNKATDSEETENVTKILYKTIEINIKFYRYKKIEELLENTQNKRSAKAIGPHNIQILKTNMISLINSIKTSLNTANTRFKENNYEKLDNETAYLALLTQQFNSTMKYYGASKSAENGDEDLLTLSDTGTEEDAITQKMEEIGENMETVDETLQEAEQDLQNL